MLKRYLIKILLFSVFVTLIGCDNDVDVYFNEITGNINPDLLGYHSFPDGERYLVDDALSMPVRFVRGVVSRGDGFSYDCSTKEIASNAKTQFHGLLDAGEELGVPVMFALAYVPECVARNGFPKAPPENAETYTEFLDVFFDEFVTQRIANGLEPLRYIEAWNEPDLPDFIPDRRDVGTGHGFVGSAREYVDKVFIPFNQAVERVELQTGVDINVGVPASFWLLFGGYSWTYELMSVVTEQQFKVEFISYHTYLNYPFNSPGNTMCGHNAVEGVTGLLQNPLANPHRYISEVNNLRKHYPNVKLMITEWDLIYCDVPYIRAAMRAASLVAQQRSNLDAGFLILGSIRLDNIDKLPHYYFGKLGHYELKVVDSEDSAFSRIWTLASKDDSNKLSMLIGKWHASTDTRTKVNYSVGFHGLPAGRYKISMFGIGKETQVSISNPETPTSTQYVTVEDDEEWNVSLLLDGDVAMFLEIERQ